MESLSEFGLSFRTALRVKSLNFIPHIFHSEVLINKFGKKLDLFSVYNWLSRRGMRFSLINKV